MKGSVWMMVPIEKSRAHRDEIVERRAAALVLDDQELRPALNLEQLAHQVLVAADARRRSQGARPAWP